MVNPEVSHPKDLPNACPGRDRYAVLGHPVAHSLSPILHHAGFKDLGLDAEYLRIDVPAEELADAIPLLKKAGFRGWNCTLPHKNAMFSLVDETDATAQEAKSVNTVRVENGRLRGFSTDALGWRAAVQEHWKVEPEKLRVLVLGCGGVGQTLARSLARSGCKSLTLANRNASKAQKLFEELGPLTAGRFPMRWVAWQSQDLDQALHETDLLIQGTSLGLIAADPLPLNPSKLPPGAKIYDTVYRKEYTPLVQVARKQGYQAEDGLSMLFHQGALSFGIWTGRTPPMEKMRTALLQAAGRSP